MIKDLQKLIRISQSHSILERLVQCQVLSEVQHGDQHYPLISFTIGSKRDSAPVLFITGGIHGLERIGAQLAWSLLKTTIERLIWDKLLQELFKNVRLIIFPLVNPYGYYNFTRSNGNGVDLMRNSPIRGTEPTPFLLGGQNYTSKLAWYHGSSEKYELESQSVYDLFRQTCFQSPCVIALDFHSGFGMKDRLWFPYSHTKVPFESIPELHSLINLFEDTHPYHIYHVEPQSKGYLLNGDLWDHFYIEYMKQKSNGIFLPLTLEMGSWTWVRKNPLQLFSRQGAFNPIKEHRIKRTYRRHHLLFDFILRALNSNENWSVLNAEKREQHLHYALERWYE